MTARPHPSARRRGLTSVAALVALLLVALVCAAILKVGLARRAALQGVERGLQADWLAASALDRAAARLALTPDYPGETWEVPASELGDRGSGRVEIRVEAVADHPDRRRVAVTADYPGGSIRRARRAKSATIALHPQPR